MRVLITGGAGFLGSHLCDRMIDDGHEVVCVDNLVTGSMTNIRHLQNQKGFRFMEWDVVQVFDVEESIDCVFHFASPASPTDFERIPLEIMRVNSVGTENLLKIAHTHKASFLLASTSEAYGDPLVHPQPEDYRGNVSSTGIRSVYDESKRFGEAMTMAYHRLYDLNTHIARIFNTYGPRLRDGRAIPTFIMQALAGDDLTVFGNGKQTRSYQYVSDLLDGVIALQESSEHMPVNLGNPDEEHTVSDLAEMVINLSGSSSSCVVHPLPPDDPKIRRPDITKAKQVLNWEPKVSLEEGLARTISFFREAL